MVDEKVREKLLQTAYDKGYEYENIYRGCGQVVVAALILAGAWEWSGFLGSPSNALSALSG